MSAPKIFEGQYYERMRANEDQSWWNAGMRDVAGMLFECVTLPARGVMLDAGCGSGQTMGWFARLHPGWRAIGFDLSAGAVAAARHSGAPRVVVASALQIPFEDRSVDLAITLDVMQHLPLQGGDRQALGELRRVLKPGGYLFVRTNAQAFPHTRDDPQFNFHKYETQEFRDKLEQSGFVVMYASRLNALLGLAEIPRELRAKQGETSSYHGLLATPAMSRSPLSALKRAWLRTEGRLVRSGLSLPFGRTIIALCRA